MDKNSYLNTGVASLIAFVLLLIMNYSWPLVDYSLNDVILGNVKFLGVEKENLIKSIGINYTLDTIFIFSWIASWFGIFLHFKSLNIKLISICFGLSFFGALLDILENSISFSLLTGSNKSVENSLFIHSVIRDMSFWLPMIASFLLALILPKSKEIPILLLKLTGIIGVLFAILGMYIQFFSAIPYYWFVLWFLVAALFLFDKYRNKVS